MTVSRTIPSMMRRIYELEQGTVDISEGLKGMIRFPCHRSSKMLVYEGTHGKASMECPICRKICIFDYDKMTSRRGDKIKGAVKELI